MNRNFGLAPGELPLLPPLRARGMAVLWNPRSEVRDFLSVIEGDPALTATVLRASNAAYSAPREPIHAARDAIVRIGLDVTRQIVSAAVMRSQFEHLDQAGLNVPVFWGRQLAVGLLTHDFARHDRRSEDEISSAFVVGLLHSVGRISLAVRSPDRYRSVVQLVREGAGILEAERQAFGIDTLVLTRQVARRWSLPPLIEDALAHQDDFAADGLPRLLREAIEVADLLGLDEGFAETSELLSMLPADHPRALSLDASGGPDRLCTRIDWFTEASGSSPSTARVRPRTTRLQAPTPDTETSTLHEAA